MPILILAICDPLAALFGKKWPVMPYKTFGYSKTGVGSLAFFSSAFCLSFLLLLFFKPSLPFGVLLVSLQVATVTTLAEAITHKGFDNLTIPLSALLVLTLNIAW